MKKVVLFLVMVLSAGSLMAQSDGHRGIDFKVDFGYSISTKSEEGQAISTTGVFGKRFSDYFFLGAGSGFYMDTKAMEKGDKRTQVPVFADIRGYYPLENINIAPFIGLKGGYVINTSNGSDSYLFQIAPGIQIPLTGAIDLNLAVGYELWIPTKSEFNNSNLIAFRIGFGFHKSTKK